MLISNEWKNNIDKIEGLSPLYFLRDQTLRSTMYQSDLTIFEKEINYIFSKFSDRLQKIAISRPENQVGQDLLQTSIGTYCPNDVHHLYHVCKFVEKTGIGEKKKILEWGGGYGNMAKIFYLAFPELVESYSIFDLPEIQKLQESYLGMLGLNSVNLFSDFELFNDLAHESNLFISTWALSECPIELIDQVEKSGILDKSFLVSLHQCGSHIPFFKESSHLLEKLRSRNCISENNQVIPGINLYLFKLENS